MPPVRRHPSTLTSAGLAPRTVRWRLRQCAAVLALLIVAMSVCAKDADGGSRVTASTVAGITFPDESIRVAMLDVRYAASDNIAGSATLAYLDPEGAPDELQLRLAGNITYRIGNWIFDTRHMLVLSSVPFERYRGRLRLIHSNLFDVPALSLRAWDELHINLNPTRPVRNNLAFGFGLSIGPRATVEIFQVWARNHRAPDDQYGLALLTFRL